MHTREKSWTLINEKLHSLLNYTPWLTHIDNTYAYKRIRFMIGYVCVTRRNMSHWQC